MMQGRYLHVQLETLLPYERAFAARLRIQGGEGCALWGFALEVVSDNFLSFQICCETESVW